MLKFLITIFVVGALNFAHADGTTISSITGNKITNETNTTPSNNNAQHTYFYRKDKLEKILQMYAADNGLQIIFAKNLPTGKRTIKVSGQFKADSSDSILNQLSKLYGFTWFIDSGTLHITNNSNITKSIEVAGTDMPMLKNSLTQLGVLNPKFGYSELTTENKLVVNGPSDYVDKLLKQIRDLNIAPSAQQFAVYRLKYASATDMQLSFNNKPITIPGVATILQNILSGRQNNGIGSNRILSQVSEPIKNQLQNKLSNQSQNQLETANTNLNIDATTNNNEIPDSNITKNFNANNQSQASASNPLIQADNRLNTIIIRDKSANLKVYKNLIELLDVPSPLIQIEVLMVHLDQNELQQNGINWWGSQNGYSGGFGAGKLASTTSGNDISFYYGQINPGQVLVSNVNNFIASVDFLSQHNIAQVTARPTLATTDNIPAIINVSENIYNNQGQISNTDNNGNTANNRSVQVTTSLEITPHVIFDGNNKQQIKLSIALQDGTIANQSSATTNTIQTNLNSQAVIKENQSILLAGYTRKVHEDVTSEVPYLSKIPVLGWFFKSTSMKKRNLTTLYLVTPKIYWMDDMHKLKDFVTIGGNKIDIQQGYQIIPRDARNTIKH